MKSGTARKADIRLSAGSAQQGGLQSLLAPLKQLDQRLQQMCEVADCSAIPVSADAAACCELSAKECELSDRETETAQDTETAKETETAQDTETTRETETTNLTTIDSSVTDTLPPEPLTPGDLSIESAKMGSPRAHLSATTFSVPELSELAPSGSDVSQTGLAETDPSMSGTLPVNGGEDLRVAMSPQPCHPADAVVPGSALDLLRKNFGLSRFDLGVMLMAIAPEIDHRYRRLYTQLQCGYTSSDKPSCYKPTAKLALDVLCANAVSKFAAIKRFSYNSPLVRTGLIQEFDNQRPLLTQAIRLNGLVLQHLLEPYQTYRASGLEAESAQLSWPVPKTALTATLAASMAGSPLLPELIARLRQRGVEFPLTLYFVGMGEKQRGAEAIAAAAGRPLLQLDLARLIQAHRLNFQELFAKLKQILLRGRLWNAVLFLENLATPPPLENLLGISSADYEAYSNIQEGLFRLVTEHPGITIFTGNAPQIPTANGAKGVMTIPFTRNSHDWHRQFAIALSQAH